MSDAKYAKELQIALNDVVNMGLDGEKMSMLPTLAVNRGMAEDNDSLYLAPEHMMLLDDVSQIQQIKIQTNPQGMFSYYNLFKSTMQQILAVYPPDLGDVGKASTTATATINAGSNSSARRNYKSLTVENTFLIEMYWMMIQMAWQYMHPHTASKIMDEDEQLAFKADGEYSYVPVTTGIEAEYNKQKKIQNLDQNIGRLVGLVKLVPEVMPLIMKIEADILEAQGGDAREYAEILEKISNAKVKSEDKGQGGEGAPPDASNAPPDMENEMTQNQSGGPVSPAEEMARGM
jgi:hypothetical protein